MSMKIKDIKFEFKITYPHGVEVDEALMLQIDHRAGPMHCQVDRHDYPGPSAIPQIRLIRKAQWCAVKY